MVWVMVVYVGGEKLLLFLSEDNDNKGTMGTT
jgi:hypothetical protein